jgi:para-nitrobenzyl esterase
MPPPDGRAVASVLWAVLLAFGAAGTAFAADDAVVTVTGGAIQGEARGAGAVFRGVPFASPPVGDRRWRPPAPVVPWTGVRERRSRARPACNGPTAGTPRTPPTAARTASISTSARQR